ncbi:MAG: protein kinase [Chloroflexaceae bacterium]|nr:protein kinase [Chloroflexaceae bacterium]
MIGTDQRLGTYVLKKKIGEGAFSEVWLAQHLLLHQRRVAIKILTDQKRESVLRFAREANISSRLYHPNIVQVFDYGQFAPYHCTILEYIPGTSLAQELRREKRLPPERAVAIFRQIADALDYAHTQDVTHRDVSPGNILLEEGTKRAVLTDFGIARESNSSLTITQQRMGTPDYASPEHAQSATAVNPLSDIYSLGVVFYQMLSGELPWAKKRVSFDIPAGPLVPLKERGLANLPSDLDRIMRTLLHVDPAKRYQTAGAAAHELERAFTIHNVVTQVSYGNGTPRRTIQAQPVAAAPPAQAEVAPNAVELLLGSELTRVPMDRARQRAAKLGQPEVIATILNDWSQQSWMRRRMLGRLARIHSVRSRNVYRYELRVLYERRDAPYAEEHPDRDRERFAVEVLVDRWQVPLPAAKDFKDDSGGEVKLPGSTKIRSCPDCSGRGVIICSVCNGSRRVPNPDLDEDDLFSPPGSNGVATVGASRSVGVAGPRASSAKGATATAPAPVVLEKPATVPCPACGGSGGATCGRCDGVTRLVQYQCFRWKREAEGWLDTEPLPLKDDAWIDQQFAEGKIYREEAQNGFLPVWSQIPLLRDMVKDAQDQESDALRVLRSEVSVSFMPVTDVTFDLGEIKAGEPRNYQLTLCGHENRVVPENWRIYNWERIVYLSLLFSAILLALIFALVAFGR